MTRTFTVGQLTGSVRFRGDLDDPTGDYDDSHISTAALMDFLASAHAEAYDILVDADPDRFSSVHTASLDATGSAALPDDLYRLRAVDVRGPSDSGWLRVDRYELGERDVFQADGSSVYTVGAGLRYRLVGEQLSVQPDPESGTTARLTYVPLATRLSSSAQTVPDVNGLPELTVLLALRRCKVRAEEPIGEIDAEIRRQTDRLRSSASARDRGSPRYLEDPRRVRAGRLYRRR